MKQIQEEKGIKVKSLENEPVLPQHLYWIWQSFSDLSYRRSIGFAGPLPISYSDLHAYCQLKGIRVAEDKERLTRFVEALDREFMANAYKDAGKEAPKPLPKNQRHKADVPRHRRRPPTKELML